MLQYDNPQTRAMAQRLLDDARHDRKISIRQLRRLEGLFGAGEMQAKKIAKI